jgi:hypothetical protein
MPTRPHRRVGLSGRMGACGAIKTAWRQPDRDWRKMSEHPIRLVVSDDLHRRRLTVVFRLLLAIPHYIWASLWTIVALFAAIANWLAALALGRAPSALHRFLAAYVKYVTQLYAYLRLAAEPYPPFDGQAGYPIDVTIAPPARQRRWRVLARLPLALPALAIAEVLVGNTGSTVVRNSSGSVNSVFEGGLLGTVAVLGWFAILARGRMPRGLRDGAAYTLSYGAQLWAYLLLLTERYPDSDPLAALADIPDRDDPVALRGADDLRRSRLMVLFRLPLCFPHFVWLTLWGVLALLAGVVNWVATLIRGRSPAALHRFLAAYLRYGVSVYAFLYVVANPFPGFGGGPGGYPLDTVVREPERQGRWTVLFRLLLVLPALLLDTVYASLGWLLAVLGWISALIRGRVPRGLRNAGALALRYHAQTVGYLLLLTDSYPYSGPCASDRPPGSASTPARGGEPPESLLSAPASTEGPREPPAYPQGSPISLNAD